MPCVTYIWTIKSTLNVTQMHNICKVAPRTIIIDFEGANLNKLGVNFYFGVCCFVSQLTYITHQQFSK